MGYLCFTKIQDSLFALFFQIDDGEGFKEKAIEQPYSEAPRAVVFTVVTVKARAGTNSLHCCFQIAERPSNQVCSVMMSSALMMHLTMLQLAQVKLQTWKLSMFPV
jgi:hypothetical protein